MHISPQLQWFRSKGLINNYFLIPQPEMAEPWTSNTWPENKGKTEKEEDKNMNFHNWLEMRKIGVNIKL